MVLFNISGSDKLWKISGGKGCGPEFMGIRSKIEANDWRDALFKTMLSMDLEWSYDLAGEWIETESNGERHRFHFKSNPEVNNYIGDFEINGKKYRGEIATLENDGSEILPPTNILIEILDGTTGYSMEVSLSEVMPPCIIKEIVGTLN